MPPLFHPRVLRERLARHSFPADLDTRRALLAPWIERLHSGELARTSEVTLHGPFLEKVFGAILGYKTWAHGGDGWDLQQEVAMRGGKQADGAIGWFAPGRAQVHHAPIELKSAAQSLDAAGSRSLTPVQQAWDYANRSPGSRWIIVSNYKETRLYSKARSPEEYERFLLADLDNEAEFRRFWLLLSRENFLPAAQGSRAPLDELLDASAEVQSEVTDALYRDYRDLRRDLFGALCRAHSNLPPLDMVRHTQKLLDRFLFVAFAEDRGLVPPKTIATALEHVDLYRPRPVWENLQAVFRWVDEGNPSRGFPPYNGGLFAEDPELDALAPDDVTCRSLKALAKYDFREDVSVEVLGHIFEQSITDLEELRTEAAGEGRAVSKRKAEGVFYTPSFVTRHIVEETLGRAFREQFYAAVAAFRPEEARGANKQREAWISVWLHYREALRALRVLDPACGSGAFLIAAFDALHSEYQRVNASLASLRGGQHELFDLDKTILNQNLFGMDLNPESVEITKLSLWLKTASPGNKLTWLDGNIRCGNSVVSDPRVHPRAVDWTGAVPMLLVGDVDEEEAVAVDARWREGFDVVLGNPPYVRQELLTPYKEHWRSRFTVFDGVADIYVYFFELGLTVLKPGGRLGFVVANKWLKGGYAAPLRKLLAERTEVETLIDFGHAPIFPDADAFPSIITFRKPLGALREQAVEVTQFPREELGIVSVAEYVREHQRQVSQSRFGAAAWSLEDDGSESLMAKLRDRGTTLLAYAGRKPYRGLLTGLNEAFLVDEQTRSRILREDPSCSALFHRFLRGQDIDRWAASWGGDWLILIPSSNDRRWPWTDASDAEAVFRTTFPSIYAWFEPLKERLKIRTDKGRYWWELRSCAYYGAFTAPKIVYQVIQYHPCYALDSGGFFLNDKGFALPTSDPWLIAVLNSPLMWWHNWRYLGHMKDEALTPLAVRMEGLPIAVPSAEARSVASDIVPAMVSSVTANQLARQGVLDVLRTEYGVDKPGEALGTFHTLDADEFVREVVKRRRKGSAKLRPAELGSLRALHEAEALPVLQREQDIARAERRLSDLVNAAYGLTDHEIAFMRETAPPRMPPGLPG